MEITVENLKNKINSKGAFSLIDVREEWEFEESNIENSKNIPVYSIPTRIVDFGEKNSEIIVFCKSGTRGNIAKNLLVEAGYENVQNLIGGKTAWDGFLTLTE